MLDETIELLTEQMLKDTFKAKAENRQQVITMNKADLYRFCIKLVKLIRNVENMEG